jgi:DNA-binding transcriptional regulator/RsmH inhibitor MraZ
VTPAEFEEIAGKLGELEDYLIKQVTLARAIGHNADAMTLDEALRMTIAAHAQCHLLVEHDG